jgi:hypothetical protein
LENLLIWLKLDHNDVLAQAFSVSSLGNDEEMFMVDHGITVPVRFILELTPIERPLG